MKPIFIENNVAKLKAIIREVSGEQSNTDRIKPILLEIEQDLEKQEDEKDSFSHIILLSVLLIPIGAYLLYKGYYWPSLILVTWVGAVFYYRTNEKSLDIIRLKERAKISPNDTGTKVNYLLSSIHQKQGRLALIKNINILFWPFVVFMGQLILNETIPTYALWIILLVIGVINAIFWTRHFASQKGALDDMEKDLNSLNSSLLLSEGSPQEHLKLYADEEE